MNNLLKTNLNLYDTFIKSCETEDDYKKFYDKLELAGAGQISSLTEKEKKLEGYMQNERNLYEQNSMQSGTANEAFPSAQPFYSQKKKISQSNLYKKVFAPMPKGGLLHVHSCAGLSFDGLLDMLKEWDIAHENDDNNRVYIITEENNLPAGYITGMLLYGSNLGNLRSMCRLFTEYANTQVGMDNVSKFFTFAGDYAEDIPYAWDFFNEIFLRTSNLFSNKDFYEEYHIRFFKECLDDNIPYVEVRSGFETFNANLVHEMVGLPEFKSNKALYFYEMLSDVDPESPDDEFLKLMHSAMDSAAPIEVKVILNARRDLKPEGTELSKLSKKVDAAICLVERYNSGSDAEYRDFLIGFDFVSEEDRGQTTDAYAEKIIYGQVGSGYDAGKDPSGPPRIQRINFFLHDGESVWPDNKNMASASAISRHRIGHGISLVKNPKLLDGITCQIGGLTEPVLEICPISNQLLRYYKDIRNHPLNELLKRGILCVIANDDPQLLGNPGLSYDIWEAYVAFNLPLAVIKGIILTAYYYRSYDYTVDITAASTQQSDVLKDGADNEQEIMKKAYDDFNKDWNEYIENVYDSIFG